MTDFEAIDYFTDESIPPDPWPYFDFLLSHPVWREPHHGVVIVSGYQELLEVYHDPDTYSSAAFMAGPDWSFPEEIEGDDISDLIIKYRDLFPQSDQLPSFDPPVHTDQRAIIMRLITPKRLKENEEFMWRLADRQLDEILPRGGCEFLTEYGKAYTLLVVADLLGVPESDHPMLLAKMGYNRMQAGSLGSPASVREASSAAAAHSSLSVLYDYFVEAIEDRRRNPRDDVLTGMATATFPDGRLPDPIDGARIASNLFAAGQETTVRLMGALLQRICEHPDEQKLLRERRDLIPNYIEETLRTDGPGKGNFRLARRSTTLGGVEIPAGTKLLVLRGAAGRDARQFECPGEFRVDRANARQHVGFGHGIHTCPGSPLARSESRVTLERLFDRTTDIRIDENAHGPLGARRYEYLSSYLFRGLVELHVTYTVAP
jgi:cytochrome P450